MPRPIAEIRKIRWEAPSYSDEELLKPLYLSWSTKVGMETTQRRE